MRRALLFTLMVVLVIGSQALADKPFLKIIDLAHTPKHVINELESSWSVELKTHPQPPEFNPRAFQQFKLTIKNDMSIPHDVKKGVILIIASSIPFEFAKGIVMMLDYLPGTNEIFDTDARYVNNDVVIEYTKSHKYAVVLVRKNFAVCQHSSKLYNLLDSVQEKIGETTKTKRGRVNQNQKRGGSQNTTSGQSTTHIDIGAPPSPTNNLETFEEENYAIPLPAEVHVLKINGHPYPAQRIDNKNVAIVPKDAVPKYYKLKTYGVCAELQPAEPGTDNPPNGMCADYQDVTLCAWSAPKDEHTIISLGATSTIPRTISYDLYIPKDVASSLEVVRGKYIPILIDPMLRIYLEIRDENVTMRTLQIEGVSTELVPKGVISFGACDVTVQDLNVIQIDGKRYRIQFQIADKGTPIYASNVTIDVDGKLIIPQRDDSILGYSATTRLADGAHRAIISANVPGCGEVRYMREFSTGQQNMILMGLGVLLAILVAYVLVKTVSMR